MKRILVAYHAAILLAAVVLVAAGCGKEPPSGTESAPFRAAIGAYLQKQGMGMRVAEMKSLEIDGDNATAVASMQEAEGTYGIKVVWEFKFKREQGAWAVVSQTGR